MAQSPQPADSPAGLADLLQKVPQGMLNPAIKDVNATIQLRSLGEDAGDWILAIKNGVCTVERGVAPSPTLTIQAASNVWRGLIKRQLDPAWAFMSGQLSVIGDLNLAMRLQSLLSL